MTSQAHPWFALTAKPKPKRTIDWSKWGMIIAFVAILVLAVTALLYGLLSEGSPHLLKVCWLPDGAAQYAESDLEGKIAHPACAKPKPLIWPQGLPLTVALRAEDEAQYHDRLTAPINLWNDQVGMEVFRQTTDPGSADIVVDWFAAYDSSPDVGPIGDAEGYCIHHRSAARITADMAVRPAGNVRTEYEAANHELGHCAGLGHWVRGVMKTDYVGADAPALDDLGSDPHTMQFDWIDTKQRALLRQIYGNRPPG